MREIVATFIVLVGTLWVYRLFGSVVVRAVRTGRWSMNGAIFDRADRPLMYYFAILMFSLFIVAMSAASCAVVLMWLG
jgi:hypothetical protein